jgi:hypothetical protein
MNARAKKIILLLLAGVLLFGAGQFEKSLNLDRDRLGLTHMATLENAPPMLAFTTVALGGFRGLISNFLWMRSNDLQLDDKFFEAAQLADWITDLEPHFEQVWVFEAWNMAFNISVKFKENAPGNYSDRWRWLEQGIELLRDRGLRYNPGSVLIYRELAWFFQFKIGHNLDDANKYYKQQWALEMRPFFGPNGTNFDALLNPQTAEDKTNAVAFREKYKMDPVFAKKVDEEWGPLDWRLAEAHAIYWGQLGLDEAGKDADKAKTDDEMMLRRVIYQSLQQSFYHGRLIANPFNQTYALGPNLDLAERANSAYEKQFDEEPEQNMKDGILKAQRNFLRDAVYFLYENNRLTDAARFYKLLGDKFPDKGILDGDPNSFPKNLTLDEYAVARVQSELGDISEERTAAVVQGLLVNAYMALALGQDDRFAGFSNLARKAYDHYGAKTSGAGVTQQRVALPPFPELNNVVLHDLLDPQTGIPYAARAVIRTSLRMSPETNAPPVSANVPPVATTNAVEKIPTNYVPVNPVSPPLP